MHKKYHLRGDNEVNQYSKSQIIKGRIKFIIMSLIGIILFLTPISVTQDGKKETTLTVAYLAGQVKTLIGDAMPLIIVIIITLSGIL